jgi:GNAT superfamily N-acetyltransferase
VQVRVLLPDALDHAGTAVTAIGMFEADELCGVAAWTPHGGAWECHTLAVRVQSKRQGNGTLLKQEVINRARADGIEVVWSLVRYQNEPMLRVNAKLGAIIRTDPTDFAFKFCAIPVRQTEQ